MQIKKTALRNRKTLDPDPADHIAAGAVENPGTVGADHDEDLAELVWKYFGEEISEAFREVQEALAAEQGSSSPQVSQRK